MSIAPRYKTYGFILLTVLLLAVLPAMASELGGLQFTMEADPATMTAPGKVNITVRLSNSGETDIDTELKLYDADDKLVSGFYEDGALHQLKVGDTKVWTGEYEVTQKQLDAGKVIFTVKAEATDPDGNAAVIAVPAEALLTYIGEKVDLSVKRTIAPEVVRKDDTVTVMYELFNSGNVKLSDLRIREHSSISGKTETLKALDVGESATVKFEKKAGTADLQSHPNIMYKKQGSKEVLRTSLDLAVIPVAKPKLKLTLDADNKMVNIGDKVTLSLTMLNEGNVSYTNVTVSDKKLGEVFTGVAVPAKETVHLTREVTMQESGNFRFDVVLEDNTGRKQTEQTNEIKISAYDPAKMIRLSLAAQAEKDVIETMPAEMHFTVTLTNNSDFEVKGITVYHGETKVGNVGKLAAGESIDIERLYLLSQGGKFRFTAKVVDSQKNTQSFDSNEIDIPFIPATPAPTREVIATVEPIATYTPVPNDIGGIGGAEGTKTVLILTVAAAVLFGLSFVLFAAATIFRARAKYRTAHAVDHLEREEKRDYANPDTYRGEEETESPDESADEETLPAGEDLPHTKYLREEENNEQESAGKTVDSVEAENADEAESEPEPPKSADEKEEGGYRLTREAPEEEFLEEETVEAPEEKEDGGKLFRRRGDKK